MEIFFLLLNVIEMNDGEPKRIDIWVTYQCNNNCLFCVNANERKKCNHKSFEEIKNHIEEAKNNGVKKIVFSGGEPTIYPKIIEIIKFTSELNFKEIWIVTNGKMFYYKKFVEKIIDAGLTNVLFSLLGHNSQLHDYLTRSPGSFKQLIEGIKNLDDSGMILADNTVILKLNYRYLTQIINILSKFNLLFFELTFVNPCGNAWKYKEKMIPKLTSVMPFVYRVLDESTGIFKSLNTLEAIPFCFLKGYEKHSAEIYMAKDRKLFAPNFTITDLNKSRIENAKIKGLQCKKCKFFLVCEGIWINYAKIYGITELKPVVGSYITDFKCFSDEKI